MKPAARFLFGSLALIVILTLATLAGVLWHTNHAQHQRMLERLKTTSVIEADLQANRLQELQIRAHALASDPAFVAYVAQSLIPNPQLGGAIDSLSITDQLNERRHGYDVALVLDPTGKLVARSGLLSKADASIQHDPLVTRTISTLKSSRGLWAGDGQLYWVSVNPLLRAGALQGVLVAATRLDDAFAIAISRMAHTDIAMLVTSTAKPMLAASSNLDSATARALLANGAAIRTLHAADGHALTHWRGDQHLTAWTVPLPVSSGTAAMVALDPDSGDTQAIISAAWPLLLGTVALAIITLLLVLTHWWRTLVPLQDTGAIVRQAAAGDSFMTVRVDGSALVRYLRDAINHLLEQRLK